MTKFTGLLLAATLLSAPSWASAQEMGTIDLIIETMSPVENALEVQGHTALTGGIEVSIQAKSEMVTTVEEEIEYSRDEIDETQLEEIDIDRRYLGLSARVPFRAPGTSIDMALSLSGSVGQIREKEVETETVFDDGVVDEVFVDTFDRKQTDFGEFSATIQADIVEWRGLTVTPFVSLELDGLGERWFDDPTFTSEYGVTASYAVTRNIAVYGHYSDGKSGEVDRTRRSAGNEEAGIVTGFYLGNIALDASAYVGKNRHDWEELESSYVGASIGATVGNIRASLFVEDSGNHVVYEDLDFDPDARFSDDYRETQSGTNAGARVSMFF